jgi:hypothetical protein
MKEEESSEEFLRFDKAMDKIMSVSKQELDRRLAEAKKNKTGKRYPKTVKPKTSP